MYGLVLEGGGAKGSYQAGALKAIKENKIGISAVVGTSIGALNGAMVVQDEFEKCLDLWENAKYSNIIRTNDQELNKLLYTKPDRETLKIVAENIKEVIINKGLDITPLRNMIEEYVCEDKIRDSNMEFGIVTYNITDRHPMELFKRDIPEGKLREYLLASAYFPLFRMEKTSGKIFIDGGFYNNLPYQMLIKKGYTKLILVKTNVLEDSELADISYLDPIIVSPKKDLGRMFDLDSTHIKRNINLGYYDTLKVLKGLKSDNYYIYPEGEKYYFRYLQNLSDEKIGKLSRLLKIDYKSGLSILFGEIIPMLGEIMEIDYDYDYEEFTIALLETLLDSLKLNKFKIYTFKEILEMINKDSKEYKAVEEIAKERFISRFGNLASFNREDILLDAARIIFKG